LNKENQRRHIIKFLAHRNTFDVDAFCIYQWIERCHFHKWWDLALELAVHLPPNSLNSEYDMRLNFILKECRKQIQLEPVRSVTGVPRRIFVRPAEFSENFRNQDHDLTGTMVTGFQFEGKRYRASSHKDVFIKVIQLAFERNPNSKERVLSLAGNKRKYFSLNKKDVSPQSELIAGTHIWVELQQNANTLYRLGKEVLSLYGMDTQSFKVITADILEKTGE